MAVSGVFRSEVDAESPWIASCRVCVPYDLDRANKVSTRALLRIFELGRTAPVFERDWCGLKSLFRAGTPWLLKAQELLISPSAAKGLIPQVRPSFHYFNFWCYNAARNGVINYACHTSIPE